MEYSVSREKSIKTEDIVYLEASRIYTVIRFYHEDTDVVLSRNLGVVLNEIGDNNFVRAHKSFAVNRERILTYIRIGKGGLVTMFCGKNIPVSQLKRKVFEESIGYEHIKPKQV